MNRFLPLLSASVVLAALAHADVPLVTVPDWQPFAAQVRRVV